jgi:hypothetical protein
MRVGPRLKFINGRGGGPHRKDGGGAPPADRWAATRQYRRRAGPPVPDLPTGGGLPGSDARRRAAPSQDGDFSLDRLLRKL